MDSGGKKLCILTPGCISAAMASGGKGFRNLCCAMKAKRGSNWKKRATLGEITTALCGLALNRDMNGICRAYGMAVTPAKVAESQPGDAKHHPQLIERKPRFSWELDLVRAISKFCNVRLLGSPESLRRLPIGSARCVRATPSTAPLAGQRGFGSWYCHVRCPAKSEVRGQRSGLSRNEPKWRSADCEKSGNQWKNPGAPVENTRNYPQKPASISAPVPGVTTVNRGGDWS